MRLWHTGEGDRDITPRVALGIGFPDLPSLSFIEGRNVIKEGVKSCFYNTPIDDI